MELGDDYSHYKFECEENQTHLHIQGILRKQERARALKHQVTTKRDPYANARKKLI